VNKRQTNNFFIPTSFSGVSTALLQEQPDIKTGYYQRLIFSSLTRHINTLEGVEQLARQIAAIARHAYIAKQMEAVEQASQLLLALPVSKKLKGIGLYYEALCMKRRGDVDGALRSLEQVAEGSTPQYRARALHNIGATYHESGQVEEALPCYLAAQRAALGCDLMTLAESQCMIAVIRSIHGDHRQSLDDLENVFPLVRAVGKSYPAFYYDYLNSLAVELGEVGRITEAETAINIALASSFASAYPQWSETREEIEQKRNYPDSSRCFVEHSLADAEAIPESTANFSVKADSTLQPECATEVEPVRASYLCLFVGQSIYQRPSTLPSPRIAAIPGGSAQSFLLKRLGRSVQSRAPPSSSCLL